MTLCVTSLPPSATKTVTGLLLLSPFSSIVMSPRMPPVISVSKSFAVTSARVPSDLAIASSSTCTACAA